jgi:CelD/BcsL family acetyltransferase involved in cellulose biosynthesis
MPDVAIDIRSSATGIEAEWHDLMTRASGNVFMDPASLSVVDATQFAKLHILLAWAQGKLVGIWALREARLSPLGPTVLAAPPYEYCFLSTPVVDPIFVDAVIPAFFAALQGHPTLPKVVRLRYLDGECATSLAILRTLSRGVQMQTLAERSRPYASNDRAPRRSKSTHKSLRHAWNRLCALGSVDVVNDRDAGAVHEAFEAFLAMEMASWKGPRGTALLCNGAHADFARQFIATLSADRKASVALLRLDGRPIAAQVLLYCGTTAYTWKISFDQNHQKCSPGALLIDQMRAALFADGIDAIDSCAPEPGFLARLLPDRRATIDVLANVGSRRSLVFTVVALREDAYLELKSLRNRLRSAVGWLPNRMLGASR